MEGPLAADTVGIGLRQPHYREVLEQGRAGDDGIGAVGFVEVHSENFFHAGGASLHMLDRARACFPISLHGVGLSLASADELRAVHLDKLARLVERIDPVFVSEHLCWGGFAGTHYNELLPLPYTREALQLIIERVDRVQDRLRRPILLENLSAYLQFKDSEMGEFAFLAEVARRTGCGILLDINNLYINAHNLGIDPMRALNELPPQSIREMHLAGHAAMDDCLIDTHDRRVAEGVWALYREVLSRIGPRPTLIEWDADLPALETLLDEARKAARCMRAVRASFLAPRSREPLHA